MARSDTAEKHLTTGKQVFDPRAQSPLPMAKNSTATSSALTDTVPKPPENSQRNRTRIGVVGFAQVGLFAIAAAYALYHLRPLLLPLILALLGALLLKPLQRRLTRLTRLPVALATGVVMSVLVFGAILALSYLATPAAEYADQLREEIVQNRLRIVFKPVAAIHKDLTEVAEKVEDITSPDLESEAPAEKNSADPASSLRPVELAGSSATGHPAEDVAPPKPAPVEVNIHKNPVGSFYGYAQEFSAQAVITIALIYFFLTFGDRVIQRLGEVDFAAELMEEVSRDVSRYLFTVSTINAGLGAVTAVAMALLGMPNPILWGFMSALLNFIPYVGAITGTLIVSLVAAITFDRPGQILSAPFVYYALTMIEGYFITPTIIGWRFMVNPIIVFMWVLAWGALWGIPGMLIGLPLLMVFHSICSKVPALSRIERVLSA